MKFCGCNMAKKQVHEKPYTFESPETSILMYKLPNPVVE